MWTLWLVTQNINTVRNYFFSALNPVFTSKQISLLWFCCCWEVIDISFQFEVDKKLTFCQNTFKRHDSVLPHGVKIADMKNLNKIWNEGYPFMNLDLKCQNQKLTLTRLWSIKRLKTDRSTMNYDIPKHETLIQVFLTRELAERKASLFIQYPLRD